MRSILNLEFGFVYLKDGFFYMADGSSPIQLNQLGNIIEGYQEVAKRLGIMPEVTNVKEVNFNKSSSIKFKKK